MTVEITSQLVARFWSKVDKSSGCWTWRGARSSDGYGQLRSRGVTYYAHRVAYMLNVGVFDGSQWVLHACDNPPCVRPDHLFLGTPQDNSTDMQNKGRARGRVALGEANAHARLNAQQVTEIRESYASGARQVDLAKKFGVTQANISIIVRGQGWKHIASNRDAFMSLNSADA